MGAHTLLVETMLKTDGEGWAEAVFRLREDMMSDMSGDLLATVLRDSVRYARHEQSALQVSAAFASTRPIEPPLRTGADVRCERLARVCTYLEALARDPSFV